MLRYDQRSREEALFLFSVVLGCAAQLAGEHRARIHDESVDAVAILGDDEGDVQRRALPAVQRSLVGNITGTV